MGEKKGGGGLTKHYTRMAVPAWFLDFTFPDVLSLVAALQRQHCCSLEDQACAALDTSEQSGLAMQLWVACTCMRVKTESADTSVTAASAWRGVALARPVLLRLLLTGRWCC